MRFFNLQDKIDNLRGKYAKLRFTDVFAQKIYDYENIDAPETIALGSSHAEVGYIASENEINFATSAQDLYYSYNLYKKLNKDSVKNIIISYSYFSPWAKMILGDYRETCAIFKAFFNIEYQDKDIANKYNLKKMEKYYKKDISRRIFYFKHKKRPAMQGNFQYYPKGYTDVDYINEGAKITHACTTKAYDQDIYLQKLLDDTKANNQKLIIVMTPMNKDIFPYIPKKEDLFKSLYDTCNGYNNCHIIDCYDSENFIQEGSDCDFYNFHHINLKGANKLTKIIRKVMCEK